MTASVREQIITALVATLTAAAPGGASVTRSRTTAYSLAKSPAIVVSPLAEHVEYNTYHHADRMMTVAMAVIARGAVSDRIADPILQAAHAAIMTDRSFGGLAIDCAELSTSWEFDDGDTDAVMVTVTYRVQYRTAQGSYA